MKTAHADVITLLASGNFYTADAYVFISPFGVSPTSYLCWYVDGDVPVGWDQDGTIWLFNNEIVWERGSITSRRGVDVSTVEVTCRPGGDYASMISDARRGYFDNLQVQIWRFLWSSPTLSVLSGTTEWANDQSTVLSKSGVWCVGDPIGLFTGRVADLEISETSIKFNFNSIMELLDIKLPRNLYSAGCGWALARGGCPVTLTPAAGTVGAGATTTVIPVTLSGTYADGLFVGGIITIGTEKRAVSAWSSNVASVQVAFSAAPEEDTVVSLTMGCDRSLATCKSGKFGADESSYYRGFPWVPAAEYGV